MEGSGGDIEHISPRPVPDWLRRRPGLGEIRRLATTRDLIRRHHTRNDKVAAMQSFVKAGHKSGLAIR